MQMQRASEPQSRAPALPAASQSKRNQRRSRVLLKVHREWTVLVATCRDLPCSWMVLAVTSANLLSSSVVSSGRILTIWTLKRQTTTQSSIRLSRHRSHRAWTTHHSCQMTWCNGEERPEQRPQPQQTANGSTTRTQMVRWRRVWRITPRCMNLRSHRMSGVRRQV